MGVAMLRKTIYPMVSNAYEKFLRKLETIERVTHSLVKEYDNNSSGHLEKDEFRNLCDYMHVTFGVNPSHAMNAAIKSKGSVSEDLLVSETRKAHKVLSDRLHKLKAEMV